MEENKDLIPFQGKDVRKIWHNDEWYFSVVDVIEVLTDSVTPRKYWNTLKNREPQLSSVCGQLKLASTDGKSYKTDCTHTQGVLRIIMSVPSPKAEPLKLWLAEQGKRTMDELNDPELLTQRQIDYYKAKGYTDEWIKERLQNIETRKKLTDEWQKRGVKEGQEYGILTATIARGTFGITPSEHGKLKNIGNRNLRDHMTDLELILTSLGEAVTRTVAIDSDAQGFDENRQAAIKGGRAGGEARRNVEKITGKSVVSAENFLPSSKDVKTGELPPSNDELLKN